MYPVSALFGMNKEKNYLHQKSHSELPLKELIFMVKFAERTFGSQERISNTTAAYTAVLVLASFREPKFKPATHQASLTQ